MAKYLRNYILSVDDQLGVKREIKMPYTMEFDITRNALASANTSSIRIHNLNEETRRALYKDKYTYNVYRNVELKAGYGDDIATCFRGNLQHCSSVRSGVDWITTMECFDGGFSLINGHMELTYPEGQSINGLVETICKSLPQVNKGAQGNIEGKTSRRTSVSGNSSNLLKELAPGKFFIDLEKVYILGDNEYIKGPISVITSQSGLLGSPVREESLIKFDMLFEPRFLIGQGINLQSIGQQNFNGFYKIISIKHRGTMSLAVSGSATTTLGIWLGPGNMTEIS